MRERGRKKKRYRVRERKKKRYRVRERERDKGKEKEMYGGKKRRKGIIWNDSKKEKDTKGIENTYSLVSQLPIL